MYSDAIAVAKKNSGDNATPLASSETLITGYCSLVADAGSATVYVMYSASVPTVATVMAKGVPCEPGIPISIQDPNGNPLPDLAKYYAAVSPGLLNGSGDLRIIS